MLRGTGRLLELAVGSNRRPVVGHRIVVAVGGIEVGRTGVVRHTGDHPGEGRHNSFGWTCLRDEKVCSGIGDRRLKLDMWWKIW